MTVKKFRSVLCALVVLLAAFCGCSDGEDPVVDPVVEPITQPTDDLTGYPSFEAEIIEITDAYTTVEPLEGEDERRSSDRITFATDTVIRVFMAWQASDIDIPMEEPILTAPAREGFTVVEWGGTVLSDILEKRR